MAYPIPMHSRHMKIAFLNTILASPLIAPNGINNTANPIKRICIILIFLVLYFLDIILFITKPYLYSLMTLIYTSFELSPIIVSTATPSTKTYTAGIAFILYSLANDGFSSTFNFAKTIPDSVLTSSSIGAKLTHGPHHSAQKSTSITPDELSTFSSKFASVTLITAAPVLTTTASSPLASLICL